MKKRIWDSLPRTPIRAVLTAGVLLAVLLGCGLNLGQSGSEFDDILSITVNSAGGARGISVEDFAVESLDIEVVQDSTGTTVETISWVPADGTSTYDLPVPGPGDYTINVDHNGVNPAGETVTAAESATVSVRPMVIAVVSVIPGQIGLIQVIGSDPVSLTFPTPAATTSTSTGSTGILGSGGGGRYYRAGAYLEETLSSTGLSSISGIDLSFDMDDRTTSVCSVGVLSWNVLVNGTVVGSYQYTGGSRLGRISFSESYSFASIFGTGPTVDGFTIRLVATSTVCPGAAAWNWFPNGTATLNP